MNENTKIAETTLSQHITPEEFLSRRNTILSVMKNCMKEGTHYGKIEGCGDKPTLLLPGMEVLCSIFNIAPDYEVSITDMGNGHREYMVTCKIHNIKNEKFLGSGIGSCSTMESKYRYINDYEDTGAIVPKKYWKERDPSILGGKEYRPQKVNNEWHVVKKSGKIERPDPADVYNTVLKMAKKRALGDCIKGVTGCSDLYTVDIEDMVPEEEPEQKIEQEHKDTFPVYYLVGNLFDRINENLASGELEQFPDKTKLVETFKRYAESKKIKLDKKLVEALENRSNKFIGDFCLWCLEQKEVKDMETVVDSFPKDEE